MDLVRGDIEPLYILKPTKNAYEPLQAWAYIQDFMVFKNPVAG